MYVSKLQFFCPLLCPNTAIDFQTWNKWTLHSFFFSFFKFSSLGKQSNAFMIMIAKKISNLHWFIQKYVDIVKNNLNDFFPSTHTCACAPLYLLNIFSDFSSVIRRWLNNSPLMNEVVKLEQHLDHLSSHWFRDLNNRLIVTTTHTICHSGPENSSKESLNQFHDFFSPMIFLFWGYGQKW